MDSDNKLDKISNDINDIKLSLVKMDMTLERNTESLEMHIKRTDLLEQKVEVLKNEVLPLLPEIRKVLKYWPMLSAVVIAVLIGKPEVIQAVMTYLSKGVAP